MLDVHWECMNLSSRSISKGVGGSYTKFQREPPQHRTYEVETPDGTTYIDVYAENRALDDEDHPTIQLIEDASSFKSEVEWDNLSESVQDEVREHLAEKVKEDSWFMD